jgi:diguanylate cyclase (GGDEF)-like protein/PAS domain S-box-containing protein
MNGDDKARILCLEHDAGLARMLAKNIERRGHTVDVARDGEEGGALLGKSTYDAVILDYDMPNMSGMEMIHKFAGRGPLPPVIMLTAEGNVEVAVEALKAGAADYIVKDTDLKYLELLPVIIEQVLSKHRLVREREQMMESIRESEERYRTLVELSPDGILLHARGALVFANPSAARYLGAANPDDLIGAKILDFIHPDYQEVVRKRYLLLESQADCAPWLEEKLIRLDGRELEVEVAASPSLYKGMPAVQEIFRDIKERKLAAKRLEHMALYDGLTDLPNRTLFFDRLGYTIAMARRNRYLVGLLFIDLDGFKQVNDSWGHDIGDLLLKDVTKRLRDAVRDSDTVARMGGDEFTVILTRMQLPGDPAIVAQKILTSLMRPFRLQGHECTVSASIGISWYPGDGDDGEALIKKADAAMYQVKQSGKRGFRFFAAPVQQEGVSAAVKA